MFHNELYNLVSQEDDLNNLDSDDFNDSYSSDNNNNNNNESSRDNNIVILGTPDYVHKSLLTHSSKLKNKNIHPWSNKSLTWFDHFSVGAYWFGWSFLWMPLYIVIIPHQVDSITIDFKGSAMGNVFLVGSVGSLIFSPLFGHMSDYSKNEMGRRRPFLIVGVITTSIGLLFMSVSPPFWLYCLAFFIATSGNFITMAPYSALVPDVVPFNQRGICSGWLGACSMLGNLMGGVFSYHLEFLGFFLTYIFLILIHGLFAYITIKFVPEIPNISQLDNSNANDFTKDKTSQNIKNNKNNKNIKIIKNIKNLKNIKNIKNLKNVKHIKTNKNNKNINNNNNNNNCCLFFSDFPFCNSDFNWLFISRLFIQTGSIIVQDNLQYYLKDTIDNFTVFNIKLAEDAVQAVPVLMAPLLFGALISSVISGIISDIYDQQRKFLVYFSGIIMSSSCILFGINRFFIIDIFISLLFGFGFGIFSAIDWAMATDVLPSKYSYGRDMGMWNLAFTLPQIFIAPLIGKAVDIFRGLHYVYFGWFLVFLFSSLNFMTGTCLVKKINHVK